MRRWLSWIPRFARDHRGAVVAEFALTLPLLLILVMGGAEVGRFILVNQKLDRAATTMADLVAQEETMTTATLNGLFAVVTPTMKPFSLGNNAVVIVSSISLVGSTPTIKWQRTGVGTLSKGSKLGTQGGTAALPTGLVVKAGETIIAVEVYYNFTTLFVPNTYTVGVIEDRTLYHRAFFRPRLGTLDTIT
jgi:Flp pilus assembly protein TadG